MSHTTVYYGGQNFLTGPLLVQISFMRRDVEIHDKGSD